MCREVLTERKQQLLSEIAAEEKLLAAADSEAEGAGLSGSEAQGQGQPEAATGDVDDSLDAFMSTMHKKLEGDKVIEWVGDRTGQQHMAILGPNAAIMAHSCCISCVG
jgi:hypothetical protein